MLSTKCIKESRGPVPTGFELTQEQGLTMARRHLELLFGKFAEKNLPGTYRIRLLAVWKEEEMPKGLPRIVEKFPMGLAQGKGMLPELFQLNNDGYDVYVGVNPFQKPSGRKENVIGAVVTHTELDCTEGFLAADIEKAVTCASPPLSFWVYSGPLGNVHPYRCHSDTIGRETAEFQNRAMATNFGAKDSVHDISRCLRLAGTINRKPAYSDMPPFRAVLTMPEGPLQRYSKEDMESMYPKGTLPSLPQPPAHNEPLGPVATLIPNEGPFGNRGNDIYPAWFRPLLSHPNIRNAWERKGPNNSVDASKADFCLVLEVTGAWPEVADADLAELLGCFRSRHNDGQEKAVRPDYVARTITAVRKKLGDEETERTATIPANWYGSLADLANECGEDTGPSWIIKDIITSGSLGILGAFPKNLKSVLVCHLALAITSGKPFLGAFPVCKSGPVLYIAAEDSQRTVVGRIFHIARGMGVPKPADLPIYASSRAGVCFTDARWQQELKKTVEDLRPTLVIIDTLRSVFGGNENDSGEARLVADLTMPLRKIGDASVLFTHHWRKNLEGLAGSGPGAKLRGSGDWHASAETLLGISGKKKGENGQYFIEFSGEHREGADLERLPVKVQFLDDRITLEKTGSFADAVSDEALAMVESSLPEGLTKTEIVDCLSVARNLAFRMVSSLIKTGWLVPATGQVGKKRGIRYVIGNLDDPSKGLLNDDTNS